MGARVWETPEVYVYDFINNYGLSVGGYGKHLKFRSAMAPAARGGGMIRITACCQP